MSGISIRTWRDLLIPKPSPIIDLPSIVRREDIQHPGTSHFAPRVWDPSRLPSVIRLVNGLPSLMHGHLHQILDTHFSSEAAGTHFTKFGVTLTPQDELGYIRLKCERDLEFDYEPGAGVIAEHVSEMVKHVYFALTGQNVAFNAQERTTYGQVVTDHAYRDQGEIKVLWEDKAPAVFNGFIEPLQEQITAHELVPGLSSRPSVTYGGYEAILGKFTYHATDVQPRVRWGIIFSALKYMVIYMPRSAENTLYCSDIMTFCVGPGDQQGRQAAEQSPPLWSLVIYMLLIERFDVDDNTLRQKFNLPVPLGDPGPSSSSLGSGYGAQGHRQSRRLETIREGEGSHYSGRLTEAPRSMKVLCFDGILMRLTLVGTSPYGHPDKCPLIHLDRHLGAVWSSVFASSKSNIVIKFRPDTIPQNDNTEVERQVKNEIAAYEKLGRITGWVVPRLYGEYEWHGGRALVMTDGGSSLEDFPSLCLVQRVVLFCELYLIHRCGVEHRDFVPRNIVQKWGLYPKIIDFGFSNTDHVCPGWNACGELQIAWRKLLLDRIASSFWIWVPMLFIRMVTRIFTLFPSFYYTAS